MYTKLSLSAWYCDSCDVDSGLAVVIQCHSNPYFLIRDLSLKWIRKSCGTLCYCRKQLTYLLTHSVGHIGWNLLILSEWNIQQNVSFSIAIFAMTHYFMPKTHSEYSSLTLHFLTSSRFWFGKNYTEPILQRFEPKFSLQSWVGSKQVLLYK